MKLAIAAAAAALLAAGCGTSAPHRAVTPRTPAPVVTASAVCAALRASALPSAAWDQAITRATSALANGGQATQAQIKQAREAVDAAVRKSCPQYLTGKP